MFVVKRGKTQIARCVENVECTLSFVDGRKEKVMFDKITSRISKLCYGLNSDFIEPVILCLTCSCVCVCEAGGREGKETECGQHVLNPPSRF